VLNFKLIGKKGSALFVELVLHSIRIKVSTYKTLEIGPYWPESGHAHITCKALLVAFVAGVGRGRLLIAWRKKERVQQ